MSSVELSQIELNPVQRYFLFSCEDEIPELSDEEKLSFSNEFEITRSMLEFAQVLTDACTDADEKVVFIPISNVTKEQLRHVVEFLRICNKYKLQKIEEPIPSTNLREFITPSEFADYIEQDYFKDYGNLKAIILAADYIDCQDLLDLSCAKLASLCRGKTKEELKVIFNMI